MTQRDDFPEPALHAHRLIWADWLDEQGQPERAAQVRVDALAALSRGELAMLPGTAGAFLLSRDGTTLYTNNFALPGVTIWDADTVTPRGQLCRLRYRAGRMVLSPDGLSLFVDVEKNMVRRFDTTTRRQSALLRGHQSDTYCMIVSPDGGTLYCGCAGGVIYLWDTHTNKLVAELFAEPSAVTSLVLSPDGRTLYAGSKNGPIHVWDTTTRQRKGGPFGHFWELYCMTLSSDGLTLYSSSFEGSLRLWDTATGVCLSQHATQRIWRMTCAPNRPVVYTGDELGKITVRDARAGTEITAWQANQDPIRDLVASPDGSRLYSAGWRDPVRIWDTNHSTCKG